MFSASFIFGVHVFGGGIENLCNFVEKIQCGLLGKLEKIQSGKG
jgi:hypothetical protein